jgi:MinD-like ATPase involved in chromosome partitioning or flagellar assembly
VSTINLARSERRSHLSAVADEPAKTSLGFPVKVVAIWSGNGSPGRTTVAVNLATELALMGKKVLLIDLDTLAPAIALNLGLTDTPAGLSAVLRLVEQGRLSKAEFERLTVRIELGNNELIFMPGLSSPKRWPEVTANRFEALLKQVSSYCDLVLVDLPQATYAAEQLSHPAGSANNRDSLLEDVLTKASKLVVISGCDPVGAKRFLEAQQLLSDLRVLSDQLVVVNRYRTAALGADARFELSQSFETLVKLRIDSFIPEDASNLDKAMRNGLPLALLKRSSPARVAMQELARMILPSSANRRRHG